jgi:hypothetical protein
LLGFNGFTLQDTAALDSFGASASWGREKFWSRDIVRFVNIVEHPADETTAWA